MKREVENRAFDAPALVAALPPAEQLDVAGQINHYDRIVHEAGRLAVQAAIATGWLLAQQKSKLTGTFEAWLAANVRCSRATAYKYMALFERTVAARGAALESAPAERAAAVAQFAAEAESKTLSELYVDMGIVKKTPSNLGGRREGAGRKRKTADAELIAQAKALAEDPRLVRQEVAEALERLNALAFARDAFSLLDEKTLAAFLEALVHVSAKMQDALREKRS